MKHSKKTRKTVEQLNVIDDVLFRKMAEDTSFCEEVLSTILGETIKVLAVTDQKDIKNLQGRSVILDAYCQNEAGRRFDVEVQNGNDDDHQRRVRYNASCITANIAEPGIKFKEVPDVVIIFIAKFDIFGKDKEKTSMYHIDRVVRETGEVVDNGLTEIYVDATVRDGSDVSELMDIFINTDKYDFDKFPKTSSRKKLFKCSEKGAEDMCTLVEEYAKDYAKEYAKDCRAEGRAVEKVAAVENCAKSFNISIEQACAALNISMDAYKEAKELVDNMESD